MTKSPAEGESTTGCMYNLDRLMMGLWGLKHVEERGNPDTVYKRKRIVYQVGNKDKLYWDARSTKYQDLLNYVLVLRKVPLVLGCRCWPCWIVCVCFVGMFLITKQNYGHITRLELSFSIYNGKFICAVYCYLESIMVVYLCSKLLIIEHQFKIYGLFDFVYSVCVYRAWGPCFHNGQTEPRLREEWCRVQ
jgi:hypothetical protein